MNSFNCFSVLVWFCSFHPLISIFIMANENLETYLEFWCLFAWKMSIKDQKLRYIFSSKHLWNIDQILDFNWFPCFLYTFWIRTVIPPRPTGGKICRRIHFIRLIMVEKNRQDFKHTRAWVRLLWKNELWNVSHKTSGIMLQGQLESQWPASHLVIYRSPGQWAQADI